MTVMRVIVDPPRKDARFTRGRNMTTLDDNKSQSAITLLMRVDKAMRFHDTVLHEAAIYALDHLLTAQRPNGGLPQGFDKPADAEQFATRKASYPESWSRTYKGSDYWHYYTFNDNAIRDAIGSFGRLENEDALNVKPNKVELVRLPRAMTLEEFNRQYPSTIPITELAIINELANATDQIPQGRVVKRVTGGMVVKQSSNGQ